MKRAPLTGYALGLAAAGALLAGCGGGASPLAPSSPLQQSANGTHHGRGGSWMAPDAKSHDLLYISDQGNQAVYVYSYPSAKLQGTLTGFTRPEGECVDKAGNVFIVDEAASVIFEYAHGGKSPDRDAERPWLFTRRMLRRPRDRKSRRYELLEYEQWPRQRCNLQAPQG